MTIKNVLAAEKAAITKSLQKSIKDYGFQKVRLVITNYFKNSQQTAKAQKRIFELKKEIEQLEKKK